MHHVGDNHHFVPQLLLKNFAECEKGQHYVHAFDKQTNKVFRSNVRNVASEKGFYDFNRGSDILSAEPYFNRIEDGFKEILDHIVRSKSLSELREDQRQIVACFAAMQQVRTRQNRDLSRQVFTLFKETVQSRFGEDAYPAQWPETYPEEEGKQSSIRRLGQAVLRLLPHFLDKDWILFESLSAPLYISDHPIVLQNTLNQSTNWGTIGFAVPGIEIYLPLSTTLCLCFLCTSAARVLRTHLSHSKIALDGAEPIHLNLENARNLNSLQVLFSSRYVFCQTPKFDLVQTMIGEHPSMQGPLGPSMA